MYSTSSCPLFNEYIDTRRSEWEEYKNFTAEKLSSMALKKYNNLLTPGMWTNKYPKDDHILALVGVPQNLADDSNKSSDKYNRGSTKG